MATEALSDASHWRIRERAVGRTSFVARLLRVAPQLDAARCPNRRLVDPVELHKSHERVIYGSCRIRSLLLVFRGWKRCPKHVGSVFSTLPR